MLKPTLRFLATHSLPHQTICKPLVWLVNSTNPWISRFMIDWYLREFAIDLTEAECEDIREYKSLKEVFTRRLKPLARPIEGAAMDVVSPVDAEIRAINRVRKGTLIQAKGRYYTLTDLFGPESESVDALSSGFYATFYLSPIDYHRVHMPVDGVLRRMTYIPGRLFSVDEECENDISNLYTRNERVVYEFDTPVGRMAYVMVGAFMVGGIHAAFHGDVRPKGHKACSWQYEPDEVALKKGDELGYFMFGSSIVLVMDDSMLTTESWCADVESGQKLRYGSVIAKVGTGG